MLSVVSVSRLTSGAQHFFCVPYGCKLQASKCVERQARRAAGLNRDVVALCKDCELGAKVKQRSGVVIDVTSLTKKKKGKPQHPAKFAFQPPKESRRGKRTPTFIDLTQMPQPVAGVKVLEQGAYDHSGSQWLCELGCGHRKIVRGQALRRLQKAGLTYTLCRECKEAKSG